MGRKTVRTLHWKPALGAMLLCACAVVPVFADEFEARYLANAGVLIRHGEAAVLFDPLFRNDYETYELVPPEIEQALFAGDPPWHDIDAVFISHHHGDHFDPAVMLDFLRARENVKLYAPAQAVEAIVERGAGPGERKRMTPVMLAYGDAPQRFDAAGLRIEAVRVPHSGWPDRMLDIENIAWRVTLEGEVTVLHLGDADTRPQHYDLHPGYWAALATDLAFPPYWYFLSPRGLESLESHLRPGHAIGVHVPADVPDVERERPPEFAGVDLFTTPGEVRVIDVSDKP